MKNVLIPLTPLLVDDDTAAAGRDWIGGVPCIHQEDRLEATVSIEVHGVYLGRIDGVAVSGSRA